MLILTGGKQEAVVTRGSEKYLLVPMLLSKALSLTASSLLGSDKAPARTSFDVYLMILSTCVAVHPKFWPSLLLSACCLC